MATIKAQNNRRNAANDGWDVIHHETEASIVLYGDGTNVESNYVRQPGYGTTTGTVNTYALALSPAPTALVDGLAICAKINVLNTGASTINVNGLGAKNILDSKGNAMTAGKLKANTPYTMRYNGTNFILQGEGASGDAAASDLYSGKTASVDAGDIVGLNPYKAGVVVKAVKDMTVFETGGKINTQAAYTYLAGIAAGNDGKVYVLYNDNGTHMLRIYDSSLTFISQTVLSPYKGFQKNYTFIIDSSNNVYFGTDYGYFVKLNTSSKSYEFTLNYNDSTFSPVEVKIDANNNIFLGIYGNLGNKNIVKLNTSGSEFWNKTAIIVSGQSLDIDQNSNVYYGGNGNPGNSSSLTLVSYDSSGNLRWSKTITDTNGYGIGKVMYCRDTNLLYAMYNGNALFKINPSSGAIISMHAFSGYSFFHVDTEGFIYAHKNQTPYGYDVYDGNLNLIYTSEGLYQNQKYGFHVKDDYVFCTTWLSSAGAYVFKINKYNKYTLK